MNMVIVPNVDDVTASKVNINKITYWWKCGTEIDYWTVQLSCNISSCPSHVE